MNSHFSRFQGPTYIPPLSGVYPLFKNCKLGHRMFVVDEQSSDSAVAFYDMVADGSFYKFLCESWKEPPATGLMNTIDYWLGAGIFSRRGSYEKLLRMSRYMFQRIPN